jgi:hypothetical protein
LRVAFLSSYTAVVAGCELRNQHGNGNYHIFFVSARTSSLSGLHIKYKLFVCTKTLSVNFFSKYGRMLLWGFNFFCEGFLNPVKLNECWSVGRGKGKLFCNFSLVWGLCVNCKCACLFAWA